MKHGLHICHGLRDPLFIIIRPENMKPAELDALNENCKSRHINVSEIIDSEGDVKSHINARITNNSTAWVIMEREDSILFLIKHKPIVFVTFSQEEVDALFEEVKYMSPDKQLSMVTALAINTTEAAKIAIKNMITIGSIPNIFEKALDHLKIFTNIAEQTGDDTDEE